MIKSFTAIVTKREVDCIFITRGLYGLVGVVVGLGVVVVVVVGWEGEKRGGLV